MMMMLLLLMMMMPLLLMMMMMPVLWSERATVPGCSSREASRVKERAPASDDDVRETTRGVARIEERHRNQHDEFDQNVTRERRCLHSDSVVVATADVLVMCVACPAPLEFSHGGDKTRRGEDNGDVPYPPLTSSSFPPPPPLPIAH
ncbi:unnamed protein product [Lampetra fluviatilis]